MVDTRTVTLGNILSMVTTVLAAGGAIVGSVIYVASVREQMNVKDRELETRILRLEADALVSRSDHDTIVEMRTDLKAVRKLLEDKK